MQILFEELSWGLGDDNYRISGNNSNNNSNNNDNNTAKYDSAYYRDNHGIK